MAICYKCKTEKDSVKDFYQCKSGNAGYCKSCSVEHATRYRKDHPEKRREYDRKNWLNRVASGHTKSASYRRIQKNNKLMSKYGLSIGEYEIMYAYRNGKCDICENKFSILCVDHNHSTSENRGLLCHPCNLMVGNSLERPENLIRAVAYLQKWSKVAK